MSQPTHGVIAAGHPKTAEAGLSMLQLGGNAFDAAIAAVMAAFVTEPALTSPAGGGFLLAHTAKQEDILFDFFTQTPRYKKPHTEIDFAPVYVNFGDAVQEFHIGLGSMAVPGAIAGLFHVHQRLGRLPLDVVAAPAIAYAHQGVELNSFQHYCLTILQPIMMATAASRAIYTPQGELLKPGMVLKMPALGETLQRLVTEGVETFYTGAIAQQLVADCEQYGGHLTLADFQNYQVIERQPLMIDYRGNTLLTNPAPSSGGTLIAFALELLSAIDLKEIPFGSDRHLKILADVMRLTNVARKENLELLKNLETAPAFLTSDRVAPYQAQLLNGVNKWGSTTHISVVDAEGNAASVTTSNGEGCGYIIPGTGVMVNNMLGEEDLNPEGFHRWSTDVRMASMMAPTIVLREGRPEIVLGSGGSNRIRTAILQVISNVIDFGMSVTEAVERPRIHWENQVLNVEPGFTDVEIHQINLSDTQERVQWQQQNMFFGGVHTVVQSPHGELSGAGDRRRSGVVLTC